MTQWFNLPAGRKSVDVDDYRGKVVFLYCFQSWCPGCHRQGFPTLRSLIRHYADHEDVVFLAVQTTFEGFGTNTAQAAQKTGDRYGLRIPVGQSGASGKPSAIMRNYRTGGTPWTVVIDRQGIVRHNDFHLQPQQAITLMDKLLAAKSD